MTDIAIRVENLSKRYRIGQYVGSGAHGAQYRTLCESLTNAVSVPLRRLRSNSQSAIHLVHEVQAVEASILQCMYNETRR